ncbi:hypothetical protein [Ferruginibacter sp.]|nr:hypothetical protein [Ferruginibacter sp.]
MKQIKLLLCGVILFTAATNTNAQLGGLLKKAKDKVTPPSQTQATTPSSTPTQTNKPAIMENTKETANEKTETTFYLYDQQYGYSSGGSNYTVAQFINQKRTFRPNDHIRKSDEKGTFHFAKDYPELAPVMEPINNAISISFHTPYNVEVGKTITSFTSKSYIYARITANTGTIKEALKIADKDDGIRFGFIIYNDDKGTIKTQEYQLDFDITPAQANSKSITVDILPDPEIYKFSKQGAFWPGATFVGMHDQSTFSKNGAYKVGFFIKNEKVDDWGKPIWGDDIIFTNFFDYNFDAKDVAAIKKDADLLNDLRVSAIKNVITELPKQWAEKTSNTVMGFTQAQLITMYQNSFTDKMDAHTVVKFHASSSNGGWTTQNNDFGIPIYRYSNQWYTIFIKYANGKTCFYQGFGLRQQYNGGGTYGKAFIDKNEYHMLDCGQMK